MSDKKHIAVRLLEEKIALHSNMVKLDKFLSDPENTYDIEAREIDLMQKQLNAMKEYYAALNYRAYYHANGQVWPDA